MSLIDALRRDGLLESLPASLFGQAQPLRIVFADTDGQHAHVAELGGALAREVTQTMPLLQLADGSSPEGSYTVICFDPDLLKKDDKVSGDVRHWLASGASIVDGYVQVHPENEVSQWIGPAPAPGTGKVRCARMSQLSPQHRYVFIVGRESKAPTEASRFSDTTSEDLKTRMGFDTMEFGAQLGAECGPTAVERPGSAPVRT